MTESVLIDALLMFAELAGLREPAALEERLGAAGWTEGEPGSGGLHRQWRRGGVVTTQFGRGVDSFVETTIELAKPDPEDPDSEDRLLSEFETKFERHVAQAQHSIGNASFIGSYGHDKFPDDLDAVMTAQWSFGSGGVGLNLRHEDWGVPFRITVTAR